MKVLFVTSDGDYGAWNFEEYCDLKKISHIEIWEKVNNSSQEIWTYENEKEGLNFEVSSFEFGDIDTDFVNFINDKIVDYDGGKHTNFYVIEEE